LRRAAANTLGEKGFEVKERSGKGIRRGARLLITGAKGPSFEVAVRTGRERLLGFSRLSDGSWRTLRSVRWVLSVVPDDETREDFVIFAFEAKTLTTWFNRTLKVLERAKRVPELDVPIFIPLDEQSKKNVGHDIVGLKKAALWSVPLSSKHLESQSLDESSESFIDRVRREFAERNEIDVSNVAVEFRILVGDKP
jgi:hypothetical protein